MRISNDLIETSLPETVIMIMVADWCSRAREGENTRSTKSQFKFHNNINTTESRENKNSGRLAPLLHAIKKP